MILVCVTSLRLFFKSHMEKHISHVNFMQLCGRLKQIMHKKVLWAWHIVKLQKLPTIASLAFHIVKLNHTRDVKQRTQHLFRCCWKGERALHPFSQEHLAWPLSSNYFSDFCRNLGLASGHQSVFGRCVSSSVPGHPGMPWSQSCHVFTEGVPFTSILVPWVVFLL